MVANKYNEYFKIGFKKSIEYKSYIIGNLTTPFFMAIFFYFIWQYIYAIKGQGDASFLIGGFTFNEMMVYLIIGLLIQNAKSSDLADRISETIKTGNIAIFLCRPVNFVKSIVYDGLGEKVIPVSIFSFLLIGVTIFMDVTVPGIDILFLFFIYGILLIIFEIFIEISIGGLAFWLTEIWGVKSSIRQIFWVLSGRALPLSLFPTWFLSFVKFTPFYYLEYTFALIYLGKLSVEEILKAMSIFTAWIFLFFLIMRLIYKKGFTKLESFGG